MTFARGPAADSAAMASALALLFVMALDWYSTTAGEEARRIERFTEPRGAFGGEVPREVEERARESAEDAERNAYQLTGAIDRVILAGLVATVLLALAAGFLRAASKRFEPPLTPSALAAACACATALLVGLRVVQQPGLDAGTTVKPGVPLALIALALVALCCTAALRAEEAGTAWREAGADGPGESADAARAPGDQASIESTR